MLVKEMLDAARQQLALAESENRPWFNSSAIRVLLDGIERAAEEENDPKRHDLQLERYKADLASFISTKSAQWQLELEEFRQIIAMGQSAMKGSLIINGGASVALLAFIGHIASSMSELTSVISFANALIFFVAGVGLSAFAFGTTYLSQYTSSISEEYENLALGIQIFTIVLVLLSFFAFFFGTGTAYSGFVALSHASANSP